MLKVCVTESITEPTALPGPTLYRLRVIGCENVAPGVVTQVASPPVSHAQLSMSTTTLSIWSEVPGTSWICWPISEVEVAS